MCGSKLIDSTHYPLSFFHSLKKFFSPFIWNNMLWFLYDRGDYSYHILCQIIGKLKSEQECLFCEGPYFSLGVNRISFNQHSFKILYIFSWQEQTNQTGQNPFPQKHSALVYLGETSKSQSSTLHIFIISVLHLALHLKTWCFAQTSKSSQSSLTFGPEANTRFKTWASQGVANISDLFKDNHT